MENSTDNKLFKQHSRLSMQEKNPFMIRKLNIKPDLGEPLETGIRFETEAGLLQGDDNSFD